MEPPIDEINYDFIFHQSPIAIYIYNPESLEITHGNEAALNLYGYSIDEFCKLSVSDLIAPEHLTVFRTELVPRFKDASVIKVESKHINKSGELIYVDVSSHVVTYKGTRSRFVYVHDITEKVKQAQQLQTLYALAQYFIEEPELSKILKKVTEESTGICRAEFGAFVFNNSENLQPYTVAGTLREKFIQSAKSYSLNFKGFSHFDKNVRIDNVAQHSLSNEHFADIELLSSILDTVSYMSVPVTTKSGEIIGSLLFGHRQEGVFTEETEKMVGSIASQAAIVIENAKLFETVNSLNTRKDEFISIASHELKTPLTSIKGYIQILESKSQKEDDSFYLNFISKANRQVNKLQYLVAELLDFSKIESGKMHYSYSNFKISELLEDCALFIRLELINQQITIEGDSTIEIEADKGRLEQVVCNFISNAAKYSPASKEIILRFYQSDGFFRFEVTDFGPGIPEEKIKFLFDRFYRAVDNSYSSTGLGLGLYISAQIIKEHGGQIGVESELGKGSTFWFEIPVSQTSFLDMLMN